MGKLDSGVVQSLGAERPCQFDGGPGGWVDGGVIALPLAIGFGIASGGTPPQGLVDGDYRGIHHFRSWRFALSDRWAHGGIRAGARPVSSRHRLSRVVLATLLAGLMLMLGAR